MADTSVATPFIKAESLQMLLANEKLRDSLPKGSLVVLDEAGLASVKMLSNLIEEAKARGWRLLFVGDPKQHVAVEAGDAFRAMVASGFGQTWHLEKIRRQNPDLLDGAYRKAARLFASGCAEEAFSLLDSKGAVHELRGSARIDAIAARYVELSNAGKSV
jgi:ATP-dependent exoDNAse (exonuclease V) alpha subunit